MRKNSLNLAFLVIFLVCLAPLVSFAAKHKDKDHPWYVTPEDYNYARSALQLGKRSKWQDARIQANRIKDPTAKKLLKWLEYTSDSNTAGFDEISDFVKRNGDWPDQETLLKRVEEAMSVATPPQEVLNWFTETKTWAGKRTFREPFTSKGMKLLGEAQLQLKNKMEIDVTNAATLIRRAWVFGNFGEKEEKDFLDRHSDIIRKEDHIARIDRLLWDEKISQAQRLMNRVDEKHKKLFKARIALIQNSYGIDELLRDVPKSMQGNQGLIFNRIEWRAERKQWDGVGDLLQYVPPNPKYPKRWWKYKAKQIQKELEKKNYADAYKLATYHGLKDGVEFAEAEWIAGWIALQFLNNPKDAYRHFYNLYQGVVTPISLARGAYWAARAAEKNKNPDIAQSWYFAATKFPTTFYGQLANRKLGKKTLNFPAEPQLTQADVDAYQANELVKAGFIMHNLERTADAKKFFKAAINNTKSMGEISLIAGLGKEIKRPDYGIDAAREVSKTGVILTKAHYPVLPKIKNPRTKREIDKPELALIHAIIVQESAFYPYAISHKDAMGLMQILPKTARSIAKKLRVHYAQNSLRDDDPTFNVMLGSTYLEDLVEHWDGSYILAIASYNGGPMNVKRWIDQNGDPRKLKNIEDIVDWIERIPFPETRNYVQRVMENLQIYRYILGEDKKPNTWLIEDLKR